VARRPGSMRQAAPESDQKESDQNEAREHVFAMV
jgi:hypothetical protein